ncbi:ammonia-forming cytochrome c nitrite reductase [Bacteroidetes/Chlorobi group bacterium ChocPot_Mid]|nr:MAG: ammonia-forming cytochrome c nitrite reductase [Bacteroidetes/Chlorobi group bacterium ChocPot_Mid]
MSKKDTKSKRGLTILVFVVTVVIVFILGLFASSVIERRAETVSKLQMIKKIDKWETRNEIWGESFPKEFETYLKTLDTTFKSKYAGSAWRDYLEENPDLVILWAGYGFSKEYNQARGHAHAIKDIRNVLRTGGAVESTQPATCWSCKSPDVPRMMSVMGTAEFYNMKWIDVGDEIVNPIGCGDCHEANTMNLKITRPALLEALERRGKKVSDFTHQEMRSLVCAQCHVEYYFKKPGNYLVFPWDKGFSADSMEKYYDELEFSDWTHKLSKAPMLKAQHPDYELFMTGIHARRGVACADCHMPYKVEGGIKFSDHHIQSPLNNISNSCQVCHRESEEEIRQTVYDIQDRVMEIRRIAEKVIATAHLEAEQAWKNGAKEDEMKPVLKNIRNAQWRWDWVAAANGVGFHSPIEALRVLGTSIQKAEQARGLLSVIFVRHGVKIPISMPDVSTKAKAQKYVGLDMTALKKDKEELMKTLVLQWDKMAEKRQGTLRKY